MDTYFVIQNSDGDTTVQQFTKEELEAWLQENYVDEEENLDALESPTATTHTANACGDTNYWPAQSVLIIRGDVVIPEIVKTATKYVVA